MTQPYPPQPPTGNQGAPNQPWPTQPPQYPHVPSPQYPPAQTPQFQPGPTQGQPGQTQHWGAGPVPAPSAAPAGGPEPSGPKPRRQLAPIWRVLLGTLAGVLVEPVREGRPQPAQWTPGLRVLAAAGGLLAVLLALAAAFGSQLRQVGDLVSNDQFITLPGWSVPVILWVAGFIVALVLSATVHAHLALHLALSLLFGSVFVGLGTIAQTRIWLVPLAVTVIIALLPLVVRRFGWRLWQFVLIWMLIMAALQLPLTFNRYSGFGLDIRTLVAISLTSALLVAAWPAIAMAGYSATELTVTTGQWLAHSVRDLGSRFLNRWLVALVLVTGAWRGWTLLTTLVLDRSPDIDRWSWTGSALVAIGAPALAVLSWNHNRVTRADRRLVWPAGEPGELAERWNPWALAFAVVLGVMLIPSTIASYSANAVKQAGGSAEVAEWLIRASVVLASGLVSTWLRFIAALAIYLFALRSTRRGTASLALLSSVLLMTGLVRIIARSSGNALPIVWNPDLVAAIASLAALGWLVVAAVRRRLHNGVLLAVWVVWLVAAVYSAREVLDNPTSLLGGISAVGLVLGGLLWRVLTDGELARHDSKAFPRSSRVLLILANALLGTFSLATTALAGGQTGPSNISLPESAGDYFLGGVLLIAVCLTPLILPWYTRRS